MERPCEHNMIDAMPINMHLNGIAQRGAHSSRNVFSRVEASWKAVNLFLPLPTIRGAFCTTY